MGRTEQTVVQLVKANLANVAYGPLAHPTLGYDPAVEKYYPYDPDKAGALLDEAGWIAGADGVRQKDGQPLKLEMIMFEGGDNKPAAELVQAMLTKLGFDASLDVTAYDAFADRVSTGKFNTSQMNWTAIDPDLVVYDMLAQQSGGWGRAVQSQPIQGSAYGRSHRAGTADDRRRRAQAHLRRDPEDHHG